ncbi:zinc-dependent peptidase [Terrimonas sp. NA20]|uniref:Zinc-dependent peptidase n=1 Tax=Terrimonas ginsenosidimutans TaxID=2908004 RepID=A0ABS9KX81_9BACT|nr:M90 family metallopeptidase [Terrimonas ginsenosidimutans]MCG2616903.1 zinc-dependent peptidase [Terrimonas ginsenosidimutans]
MDIFLACLSVLALIMIAAAVFFRKKKTVPVLSVIPLPESSRQILLQNVPFYEELSLEKRSTFEQRMQGFLARVRITGVNTTVGEIDRVLIAASAIIPIFGFAEWEYMQLNEVLLYPDSFNKEFAQEGHDRDTLGMVGSGPYQNVMILSQHQLRQDFLNKSGKGNTAIHEFVHLVDKTDGSVDGIPEIILNRKYVLPWLELMHKEIKRIQADKSDINPYGATDQGEFFAVVSEYFFERPELLKEKHPKLYELLALIFRQEPRT